MAGLRVFISSTCYDLSVIRSQLRLFIQTLGHEPVMSDYSDILYDPRTHTHTSCVDEVSNADIMILIIGSRFGGLSIPEALGRIDFDLLSNESQSTETFKKKDNISITQLEVLKAIESKIPVYTFIDSNVWHDHALYEKNKDKSIINEISFPSIEKPETAAYIFEFINFLRHRSIGNNVFSFSKLQDIEDVIKKQWSSLFQKLLQEQRWHAIEAIRIDNLADQFEDLKTAILTSIGSKNEKEVARGVVRFRRLIDFVKSIGLKEYKFLTIENHSWDEFLKYVDVKNIIDSSSLPDDFYYNRAGINHLRLYIIRNDNSFYEFRSSLELFYNMRIEWDAFMELPTSTREIIFDALFDMRSGIGMLKFYNEPFEYFVNNHLDTSKIVQSKLSSDDLLN